MTSTSTRGVAARRARRAVGAGCLAALLGFSLAAGAATATINAEHTPPGTAADERPGADPSDENTHTALERHEPEQLLTLVAKDVPLEPRNYAPDDLVDWRDGSYELREEVAAQLEELFAAADEAGHALRVISGYRSYQTQVATYDEWVRARGQAVAERISARPGHSEHQTGLAVDVDSTSGACYLNACFGDTPEGQWVAEHAHEHGFIVRYPDGASDVTGYAYEPWHLRYVGPQVAGLMHEREIATLEEYVEAAKRMSGAGQDASRTGYFGWRAV